MTVTRTTESATATPAGIGALPQWPTRTIAVLVTPADGPHVNRRWLDERERDALGDRVGALTRSLR